MSYVGTLQRDSRHAACLARGAAEEVTLSEMSKSSSLSFSGLCRRTSHMRRRWSPAPPPCSPSRGKFPDGGGQTRDEQGSPPPRSANRFYLCSWHLLERLTLNIEYRNTSTHTGKYTCARENKSTNTFPPPPCSPSRGKFPDGGGQTRDEQGSPPPRSANRFYLCSWHLLERLTLNIEYRNTSTHTGKYTCARENKSTNTFHVQVLQRFGCADRVLRMLGAFFRKRKNAPSIRRTHTRRQTGTTR